MKTRKALSFLLALILTISLMPTVPAAADTYEFWDLRNTENITTETLTGTVDGVPLTVTRYTGWYAKYHNSNQQKINIYVPSNVTPDSAILLLVNNSGWQSNNFPTNTIPNNFDYVTTGTNPSLTALGLNRGFVIVSYGARSRANPATDGEYLGHSPATMTDTKAAVRFLRYNYDNGYLAGKGRPDRIIVTGSSGGGALSVIMAASGNSPDYFPSLYEIGAAGITYNGSGDLDDPGSYTSDPDISDSLFGTIAYCPITDLPMADQAYEWTYNAARTTRPNHTNVNFNNVTPLADNPVMSASAWLAEEYTNYINGLGLVDENGTPLTATYTAPTGTDDPATATNEALSGSSGGTFRDAMLRLLDKGVNKAINEWVAGGGSRPPSNADPVDALDIYSSWLKVNGATPTAGIPAAGSVATIYDLEAYLSYVASTSNLKIAPAFDNQGLPLTDRNENNLYGTKAQEYSHSNEWSWDHDTGAVAGVGKDSTGLTWDQFLQTPDGKLVALQMKMTTPIPYLLGSDNIPYLKYAESSDKCDTAAYWYVRHGMKDRDTSFAVGTLLYYALLSNDSVKDVNFNFAWLKPHGGNYDTLEAIQWLDDVLETADTVVINDVRIPYTLVDGTPQIKPTEEQFMEILRNSGSEIVIDMQDFDSVDLYLAAGWFKGIDKTINIITRSGSFSIKTKTLWNNSGKIRVLHVSDKLRMETTDPLKKPGMAA